MSAPNDAPSLTLRMLLTGRGVRELPAGRRLIVDLITLVLTFVVVAVIVYLVGTPGDAWGYILGFGGGWLVVVATRSLLRR